MHGEGRSVRTCVTLGRKCHDTVPEAGKIRRCLSGARNLGCGMAGEDCDSTRLRITGMGVK